jgi:phage gpG-like protein
MPSTTVPGSSAAYRAIIGRLGMRSGLNPATTGVEMTFLPSIAITAGRIDKLGLDIRSFHEPLKRSVQRVMGPSFQKNFDAGGRPDPWEPLSEATLEIRQRLGHPSTSILIKTGALRKVMGQLNIWRITRKAAIITDLPPRVWYGAIHQAGYDGGSMSARIKKHGGDASAAFRSIIDDQKNAMRTGVPIKSGGAGIPARPFVMFQDDDEDEITEIFMEWLQERIARTWGTL